MKVLLVDNGSALLGRIVGALAGHRVDTLGFPFVPGELLERVAAADAVVISGSRAPIGVDLPYESEELAAIASCRKPILGIGKGAALLIEAHGGRVKARDAGYELKRVPADWTGSGVACRKGGVLVAELDPSDAADSARRFLAGLES